MQQIKSCLFYAGLHFIVSIVLICVHYFTWLGSRLDMASGFSVIVLTWVLRILTFPFILIIPVVESQLHETGLYAALLPLSSLFWGWVIYQLKHDSLFQYKSSTGVHV